MPSTGPAGQLRASKVGTRCRAARASSTRRTGCHERVGRPWPRAELGRLGGDALEGDGEGLQGLGALGLGGLDHECLVHDEREVDGRRVEALLEEPLGHVEGPHAVRLLERPGGEHHLVHAGPVEGDVVGAVQPLSDPVGVEHGHLGDPLQAVAPVDQDVGQGPGEHQGVAVPGVHPADRLRSGVAQAKPASGPASARAAPAGDRGGTATRRSDTATGPAPGRRRRGGWRTSCAGSCGRCRSPCRRAGPRRGWRSGWRRRSRGARRPRGRRRRWRRCPPRRGPRVFGLVSMMPATSSSSTDRSAAMSTQPRSSLGTVTTS